MSATLFSVTAAAAVLGAGWLTRPSPARRRLFDWLPPERAGARRRRPSRRVTERRAAELGELVDVTTVGVAAGLSLHAALSLATVGQSNELAVVLSGLMRDLRLTLIDAMDGLASHAGPEAAPFADLVASSMHYGIELSPGLDRLAVDLRDSARRRAETRVRRLPVALLFPLVLCVLPALGLVSVVPVVASAFGQL